METCYSHSQITPPELAAKKLFVGIAKVRLGALDWSKCSRDFDQKRADYLKEQFKKYGCKRDESRHNVDIMVSNVQLQAILHASNLTLQDLRDSGARGTSRRLKIPNSWKLPVQQGQHRLAAALKFFPKKKDQWWPVNVSAYGKPDAIVSEVLRYQGEYIDDKIRDSDGDIYQKIWKYRNDKSSLQRWKARLSRAKLIGLNQLLRHEDYTRAFEVLLVYPGLWNGLQLGNIQKILALRCDEEIIHYLGHIKDIWDLITLGDSEIQRLVTIETVRILQLRAPGASHVDRAFIIQCFKDELLFPSASGDKRKLIMAAILKLDVIIPSIETLFENSKLLALGSIALKDIVFDNNLRNSIHKTAYAHWKPPTSVSVEISPGCTIQYQDLPKDEQWDITYKVLWLFLFRYFPELTGIPPQQVSYEKRRGYQMDEEIQPYLLNSPTAKQKLVDLARVLGLKTRKIEQSAERDAKTQTLYECISGIYAATPHSWRKSLVKDLIKLLPSEYDAEKSSPSSIEVCFSSDEGEDLGRRWGRPFTKSYLANKMTSFLPNMVRKPIENLGAMPTALYVQADFLNAFFGKSPVRIFLNGVTSPQAPVQVGGNSEEIAGDTDLDEETATQVQHTELQEKIFVPEEETVVVPREDHTMVEEGMDEGISSPYQENPGYGTSDSDILPVKSDSLEPSIHGDISTEAEIRLPTHLIETVHSVEKLEKEARQETLNVAANDLMSSEHLDESFDAIEGTDPATDEHAFVEEEITRTPALSTYNLPATLSQDPQEGSSSLEVDSGPPQPDDHHPEGLEETHIVSNENEISMQDIPRTPIMSTYNLPATLNKDLPSQEVGTYHIRESGPQKPLEISQSQPPIERRRTQIESTLNLLATIDERVDFTSPSEGTSYYEGKRLIAEGERQVLERPQSMIFPQRTPVQPYYSLQATVEDLVDDYTLEKPPNNLIISKKMRTPVQSIYNIPVTVDRPFARIEESSISDRNHERQRIVQPKKRTPVVSMFNLPATVGGLLSMKNTDTFINWTYSDTNGQGPTISNLPETNSSPQANGERDSTANAPTISDTSFQRVCRNFLEYNGHSLTKVRNLENLDHYFATHRRWFMFGGASIKEARIIPPPSRAWYVSKYSKWTYVFVPEQYGERWKREGAALMNRFQKKRRDQPRGPVFASKIKLAKSSGDLDALPIAAPVSTTEASAGSTNQIQLASIPAETTTLEFNKIPWEELSKYNYEGQSVLLAENDLREKVKPSLGNSANSVAFLVYLSLKEWHLITLARMPPVIAQALEKECVAFKFDNGPYNLIETPIDIRLADNLAEYNMWFVLKTERQQFLEHRETAFRDSKPRQSFDENLMAGTFQSLHEESLFETFSDSEAESDASQQDVSTRARTPRQLLLLPTTHENEESSSENLWEHAAVGRSSHDSSGDLVGAAYVAGMPMDEPVLDSIVDSSATRTADVLIHQEDTIVNSLTSSIDSPASSPVSSTASSDVASPIKPSVSGSVGTATQQASTMKKRKFDTEGEYKASIRRWDEAYNTEMHATMPYKRAKLTIPLEKRKFYEVEQDNVTIRDVKESNSFNAKNRRPYKRARRLSVEEQSEVPIVQPPTLPKGIPKESSKKKRPKGILSKKKENSALNSSRM